MFELMNDVAIEVGAERRREVAIQSMRAARANAASLRRAARIAVWAVGRVSVARRRRSPAPGAAAAATWETPTATWE